MHNNNFYYTTMAAAAASPFTPIRIDSQSFAQANIGAVCEFNTTEGYEYGLILRVTPSELILQRLQRSEDGTFHPHPEPACTRSKNRVTYMKRRVMLVSAPITAQKPTADSANESKGKSKSAVDFILGGAKGLAGELLVGLLGGK